MVCACDFVTNDAYRYLGSAIIRVALGYGVPVIARSFGCTANMAAGALIEIDKKRGELDRALEIALKLTVEGHAEMAREATKPDQERPWKACARGCVDVYKGAIAARRSQSSRK
jgi:hypothetical protein